MKTVRPLSAAKLTTRLFVIVAACALAASIFGVSAYMQSGKRQLPVPATRPAEAVADKAPRRAVAVADNEEAAAETVVPANDAVQSPMVAGTCETAGPIEVESTGGTLAGVPTPYATLALAFTAINGGTLHTGAITIDVCGNTTETSEASLSQVAGVTSVTMAPAGGAARTIMGAPGAGNALILFNGADNVTINGLNTGGNSLTISNTTVAETGNTSTLRFAGDASNNTVTNCSILGSARSILSIASATISFSTGTVTGNDNNTISNNNIGPAGANLPSKAIMGSGTNSTVENDNVTITGNNIFDFFRNDTPTTGINVTTGNEAWTISNNKFYQTATRTFISTALRYSAITLNNTTGGFTVSGNTIGFGAANGTGTTTITGSSNEFRGIDLPNVRTTAPATEIQNNVISGINQTSSRSSTVTGSSPFIAVAMGTTDGLINATGNTIGSLDGASTIVLNLTSTTAGTAPVIGFYNFSFFATNISNNNIGAITIQSTGTTTGFRGILVNTGTGLAATINNNTIGGTNAAGAITDTQVGSYSVYGIQTSLPNLTATGNTIRNMSGASNGSALIVGAGILASGSTGANTISQNTIHSLSNASGAVANSIYGMSLSLPATANVIERNFIHSLSLTSTLTGTQIWGISGGATGTATYKNNMIRLGLNAAGTSVTLPSSIIGMRDAAGATNQFYHNSVYVGGTGVLATPAASNSYCFFSDVVTVTRAYQDNIFWNARSNAVAGGVAHVAIRVGGTAANPAGLTSNYNDLYFSGTDGATGVFNATVIPTLAAWRTATGQDANSFAGDPNFVAPNGTASTVDLHVQSNTPVESHGLAIASVTDDFDGQTRSTLTPTDIGADAGNFVSSVIQFNSPTYSVNENIGTGLATITLTRAQTAGAVSVTASTVAGGTATAGTDYTTTSTTVTFADGAATASFTIPVSNDAIYEGNETVFLALSNPTGGAALGTQSTAVLTIVDEDAQPAFAISDVTMNEGNGGTTAFTFNVTKTGATSLNATVDFTTVDGTATVADNDYAAQSGTLTFLPADTTMPVTVNVSGDTTLEPHEAFTVHLSNAAGATITDADGTGTITNDDAPATPAAVVYVDDDWVGLSSGTDPDGGGPATSIGYDAFATIQGGVNGVADPGTVNVAAGTYDEDVNVNKSVSLLGAGAATTNVRGPVGGDSATVRVAANNVTVAGFTVTRLGNNTTDWNNPGLNTVGVAVQGQAVTGMLIRDNVVTGNRSGLDINDSNGHTVRNNVIDFNRTGIIYGNRTDNQTVVENFITNNWTAGVLFLDRSGAGAPPQSAVNSTFSNNNISANWYAQIVDRQAGGSLPAPGTTNTKNFRNNWFGTTSPVVTTANSAEPGYAAQIPVAYGGTATPPGGQPDIAGPASANFKYTPFLNSGVDTDIETTPGRGTFGFQGGQSSNVVVTPANAQGWVFFDDAPGTGTGTGGFEHGPATPPLGVGSAFLQVDSQGRHAFGTGGYGGTRMDSVTKLSYSSYQNNNADQFVAPSLQFDIDYDLNDASNSFAGRLVFEPYQSGTVQQGVWQDWDALAGKWYGTRATVTVNNAAGVPNPCQQATPCTWQQVIASFPNAGVRNTPTSAVLFKAGGPWAGGFDGNVDALIIGLALSNTTYDFEPLPQLSINDVTQAEGNAGQTAYTFTVTLSRAFDQAVTVDYATADSTATAPSDYTAIPATQLVFNPGDTTKQFTVQVNGDTAYEADEQFFVNLSNASNATVSDAQGVGTITNDDAAVGGSIEFVSNAYNVSEPGGPAQITVQRTGGTDGTATATFSTSDGTAAAGVDYTAVAAQTVTFAPGESGIKTLDVPITDDAIYEGDETVNLSLTMTTITLAPAGGSPQQAVLTITDDEPVPTVSVSSPVYVSEPATGTASATFTFTLSGPAAAPVTLDYQTQDGTATAPDDYTAVPPTQLTFAPSQTTRTVSVAVKADAISEGAEEFTLALSNASANATLAATSATAVITDFVPAGALLITELRLRGASGPADEFVELYNNTDAVITVGTSDGSAGWSLAALSADGLSAVVLHTLPAGTVIPARSYYLVANAPDGGLEPNGASGGYSLGANAAPDATYSTDVADAGGVAFFRTSDTAGFSTATRFDAAGFTSAAGALPELFREGAALASPGANDGEYAFFRTLTTGRPADTDDNAADFTFVSTDAGTYGGVQSKLGAPGPQNAGSPLLRTHLIKAGLVDPGCATTSLLPGNACARHRDLTPDPLNNSTFGTLSIRRKFVNITSEAVTRLRFRVVDATTGAAPLGTADMRLRTSPTFAATPSGGGSTTIQGLTLETPPAQPEGGGLNSTVAAGTITLATPLAAGNSVNVHFLLGLEQTGTFRFFVNVEALKMSEEPGAESPGAGSTRKSPPAATKK